MLGPVGFFIWASNYERPRPKAHTSTPLRLTMHFCAAGQNQTNGPTESRREVRAQGQKVGRPGFISSNKVAQGKSQVCFLAFALQKLLH